MQRTANVYLLIAATLLAVLLLAAWSAWSGWRLASTPAQQRQLLDVRVLAAEAHIYLEEHLGGDGEETPAAILGRLDEAARLLAVLAGDRVQAGVSALDDSQEQRLLLQARHALATLADLTRLRLGQQQGSGAGSSLDRRFDRAFNDFMAACKTLETRLHERTASALGKFALAQSLMTLLVMASFAWLYRLLRRRDQRAAKVADEMAAAHAEVMQSREQMQQVNARQEAMLALSRRLQSAIGVEQFSQMLLTWLCEQQQAVAGVIWLSRQEAGLRAVASWCTGTLARELDTLAAGEGLVGQVALTGQVAQHAQPPGYLYIETGMLRAAPSHSLLLPVRYRELTVAVLELAFPAAPTADTRAHLQEVMETMAVRYYMFSQRDRTTADGGAPRAAPSPA